MLMYNCVIKDIHHTRKHVCIHTHTHGTLALTGCHFHQQLLYRMDSVDNISSVRQLENTIQLDPYFSYCSYIHFNAQENIYFILLSFAAKQRNKNEIPFSHVLIITIYFLYTLIGVFNTCLWHYG